MIPKKIHYCWFGGRPLPSLARKCIRSWEKYLPDYEIVRWDESNYDVNKVQYMREAYAAGKYAFVSDYARFDILYRHGGLYFDTDVELIKPLEDIIAAGPFMGCENPSCPEDTSASLAVNPGLGLGAVPGLSLYKEILEKYETLSFNHDEDAVPKTVVEYTTELLVKKGLKNTPAIQNIEGINVYPNDFFCPLSYETGKLRITENTVSIHHFAATWVSPSQKFKKRLGWIIGKKGMQFLVTVKSLLKK